DEVSELISDETLNEEAAKRYIATSLKREYASDMGTILNAILHKMSPLNPQYLTKKQSVFQKISAVVAKFKGIGGFEARRKNAKQYITYKEFKYIIIDIHTY